jgi:hypothetical protein
VSVCAHVLQRFQFPALMSTFWSYFVSVLFMYLFSWRRRCGYPQSQIIDTHPSQRFVARLGFFGKGNFAQIQQKWFFSSSSLSLSRPRVCTLYLVLGTL